MSGPIRLGWIRLGWILALITLFGASPIEAHPLDPSLLELRQEGSQIAVLWQVPAAGPAGAALEAQLPEHCQTVGVAEASRGASRVRLTWRVDCGEQGLVGAEVGVAGLGRRGTDALLRVILEERPVIERVLRADNPSFRIPETSARASTFLSYFVLGFEHILGGFDHLLFVLGLVFLIEGRRALVLAITAFTIGHSITLALTVLGVTTVPSGPVELAIAASVFVLALELSRRRGEAARRPWWMAAVFGLLHGLGFASALREAGLPEESVASALLSFNLGIEMGQLAFIAAVLLVISALTRVRRGRPVRAAFTMPAAYLIGTLSFYWMIDRLGGLLGA